MSVQPQEQKIGPGAYIALAFAALFFSGLMGGSEWYGVFDFTTLNGAFGKVVTGVSQQGDTIAAATGRFRGKGDGRVSLCPGADPGGHVCAGDD